MRSNARMTIRFEPPVKPKTKPIELPAPGKADPIEITPETRVEPSPASAKFEAWNSPFQDDIHALEEIIRKSDGSGPLLSETAFSSRPKPGQSGVQDVSVLEWMEDKLGEAPDGTAEGNRFGANNGWYDSIATTEIVRERGPSWGRVVLSVAGAIATGVLFGYMVLGLFTGEPLFPGTASSEATGLPAQPSGPSAATETAGASERSVPASGEAAVPALGEVAPERYFMLQYGVFQSAESMEAAAKQLKDKGYSWGTEENDGYRVYAAATLTKEEAELLAAQMSGMDIYIKPLESSALRVGAGELTAEDAEYFDASSAMIRELVRVSGTGLQERQPAALSDKRLAEWQAAKLRWRTASAREGGWGGQAADEAARIAQALSAGEAAMDEYVKEPSRKQLWNMQTSAMNALLAERRLREALRPGVQS
ncbi:SPOR domain-containing protein [Cohnella hongkongensis]|uniref:SPOR domain-containing protein n=1 Tax=Cohnella hongkongensis TaxID=178337 RepID=A0ABV9FET7_9BACL